MAPAAAAAAARCRTRKERACSGSLGNPVLPLRFRSTGPHRFRVTGGGRLHFPSSPPTAVPWADGSRHGHLQRVRGEQGRGAHLPAGSLRAARRGRENVQLPPGPVGHAVLSINGIDVNGKYTADGKEVLEYLCNPANYPVSIRFGRPRLSSNEKLMLASMFHSLFAIGSQLSPELGSSGIEMLETDTFKLHCFQTLTGIKFVVLADPRQAGIESLLRKIYEIYSDFALKNPFYSLEMPIRCELFDQNLKLALEVAEKAGPFGPGS
ncbi:trafficking protein particle complex subunit 4 isoform X1 [Pelodiscus sinensis]|uniref:trafficking protein particle complex subunit 4 isoform X1 n=1 Tax=Pelodiscus sinensis TaxID=13735 RepID=UPI003F6D45C1